MDRLLVLVLLCIAAPAAAPARAAAVELPEGFSVVQQAGGLNDPTAIAYTPDGRMLIAEKAGRVRVVTAEGRLLPGAAVDIATHVNTYGDRGLLGLAVDPQFASNGRIYLLYTYDGDPQEPTDPKTSRLTRVRMLPDGTLENPQAPETVLLGSVGGAPCPDPANALDCIPSDSDTHSIGTVRAAPDGTLWVGSGDGAEYNWVDSKALRSYDEQSMAGKILHIDRDGRGLPGHQFCPGEANLDLVCTKIHAKGFRNPFRFHLGPGGELVAGDVGWSSAEELNLVQAGRSYGWPCYEGAARTLNYEDLPDCQARYASGAVDDPPSYEYGNWPGAAVAAGPRYDGDRYPAAYRGSWFFADYVRGWVKAYEIANGQVVNVRDFASQLHSVDIEIAPNGDLVYVSFGDGSPGSGSVEHIVYGNRPPTAVMQATPASGDAPLAVSFTSDGSRDPDGDALTYEWDFDEDGDPDATGPTASHVFGQGAHTVTLTVRDAVGLTDSASRIILASEAPPVATIEAPADGAEFRHGVAVALRGSAVDEQDGDLGDAALRWRVILHHGAHIHSVGTFTGHEASFTPAGDHDADSSYELQLTARDSAGLEDTRSVTIRPRTVSLALSSSPTGAPISYSGREVPTPASLTAAVGYRTSISAPEELVHAGVAHRFARWSDGGARLHAIEIPDADSALTAIYTSAEAVTAPPAAVRLPVRDPDLRPATPRLTVKRPKGRGPRRLSGRLTGSARRLRVDVAVRTPQSGGRCRRWYATAGRFGAATARCSRPAWTRAVLAPAGPGTWTWSVALGGRLPPGRYVVRMRARDARGRVVVDVSSRVLRTR